MISRSAYFDTIGNNTLSTAWAQSFSAIDRLERTITVKDDSFCADELSLSPRYWYWISPSKTITIQYLIGCLIGRLLEKDIVIPNVQEVWDYLLKYDNILGIVWIAVKLALEKFGKNSQLSLEVYHDPEIDDQYLALYVRQEEYDGNIFDVIDEISEEYEDMLSESEGWFVLTSDLHQPV